MRINAATWRLSSALRSASGKSAPGMGRRVGALLNTARNALSNSGIRASNIVVDIN
jgi:hypothetical protein